MLTEPTWLPDDLVRLYGSDIDKNWCSDYVGKRRFCVKAGLPPLPGDAGDAVIFALVRTLPLAIRWVVERHTGLWSGRSESGDDESFEEIAKTLSPLTTMDVENLYEAGIALVRAEAAKSGVIRG